MFVLLKDVDREKIDYTAGIVSIGYNAPASRLRQTVSNLEYQ